ncbi:Fanconi anemia group M protein [Stegastes partitus]|uniref:Fanconi anemia group M protein n=1 Tax=Stegastes partitus TaxID=144197 RepID=A0A9Y4JYE7_9TELE|nr:PREDICTED: Fanconi anemia group M protein-like [Stegastes partitus]
MTYLSAPYSSFQVLEKFMSRLVQNRVMAHKDLRTLSKYQLILARDQFRKNPPPNVKGREQGMLEGDFALCISLYHGYELLMQMGLRSLFFYIQGIMDGSREMSRAKNELQRTPMFMALYQEMETMFMKPSAGPDEPFIYSHPKLQKLEDVVLQHFRLWAESSAGNNASGSEDVSTRVMIFSSFRESVQEIAAMLNRHAPLIKVMTFMGQASAGKGVKGFTQKEQLEVVHRFRHGGFNTLVSTCVGEEGLDIGEVDLIVCFDAQKNPIRLVQRMGRTGRKRQGRIVVILAEGREERTYNQSQSNKKSVYKSIIGNKSGFHMYPNSPRMLPDGLNPRLHRMHITCGQFDHRDTSRRSGGGRRSHSGGRASLIHPQNLIQQASATSDGFLSSAEYSLWASTMRLEEHEAHPTLRQSHFVSIPSDPPPQRQEEVSDSGPAARELSLWEWRHWQHKALPFHAVDHSLRCSHFVKVMELIDGMKEENEGECRYEKELLPYLDEGDGVKSRQKKPKATKVKRTNSKAKPSHSSWSELECIDEETDTRTAGLFSALATTKQRLPVERIDGVRGPSRLEAVGSDCPVADIDDDCVIVREDAVKDDLDPLNSDDVSQLIAKNDEDVELQAMFYLPRWDSAPLLRSDKLLPATDESLKVILANVAELLSRSPPSLTNVLEAPSPPPSPQPSPQPFVVSFTLDVDDEDEDELMIRDADDLAPRPESDKSPPGEKASKLSPSWPGQKKEAVSVAADSPTWDEVFEDQEVNDDKRETDGDVCDDFTVKLVHEEPSEDSLGGVGDEEVPPSTDGGVKDDGASQCSSHMDESIDLFEDDEAFLQMTIPDVLTPRTSPVADDIPDITERTSEAVHTPTNPRSAAQSADGTRTIESSGTKHRTPTLNAKQVAQDTDTHNTTEMNLTRQTKPVTDSSMTDTSSRQHFKSPTMQEHAELLDSAHDFFSVNFDLGYSLEDSDDEGAADASPAPKQQTDSAVGLPAASSSSTPYSSFTIPRASALRSQPKLSSPQSEQRTSTSGALPSPITSPAVRRTLMPGLRRPACLKRRRPEGVAAEGLGEDNTTSEEPPHPDPNSDSEDEVVLHKRRHLVNPLSSPEVSKITSDVDSPLVVRRRPAAALDTSDETEHGAVSDDDFQTESVFTRRTTPKEPQRQRVQRAGAQHDVRRKGRQFLDEEAALSEDEDVSSDEDDGDEQNRSLDGFVVDNTHASQGLNDSEMHAHYLKSVRSPAAQGKFKMSYRNRHNMDIFSQVPEMDETYAEDSFVVGSDVEEPDSSEEEAEDVELMPEASYVDGRRQYATRRRVFLHKARARGGAQTGADPPSEQRAATKTKRTRVIRIDDSSEDDMEDVSEGKSLTTGEGAVPVSSATIASKVSLLSKAQRSSVSGEQQSERCRQRLENQHLLSDELDFTEPQSKKQTLAATSSLPQKSTGPGLPVPPPASTSTGSVSILVDSSCISGGVELITSLRQRHAAAVHVCSLGGSYFIVSNRMAVERHSQSDLAATQNRTQLAERVKSLQALFERVCLIVEKDRIKKGEASRPFQQTRFYDCTLAALVRAGVRLLWSDGAEESAGLMADLARLEQRKGQGIGVPLEVTGQHREEALQVFLSMPSVSYVHALNMSHSFGSVEELINSPVEAIQKAGCMSRTRAEEIYRFLRYSCDTFLMNA